MYLGQNGSCNITDSLEQTYILRAICLYVIYVHDITYVLTVARHTVHEDVENVCHVSGFSVYVFVAIFEYLLLVIRGVLLRFRYLVRYNTVHVLSYVRF